MFNKDRFHNQLALNLGYQRIVNDKRITIEVDDSDDPWVTLKVQGYEDIRFKASGDNDEIIAVSDLQYDIKEIIEVVHQTYMTANNSMF